MNENEKLYEENEEMNEVEVVDDYDNSEEESEGGSITPVIAVVAGVGAAVAAVVVKNRHKIAEWRDKRSAKRLEKRGYKIEKLPDDVVDVKFDEPDHGEEE